MTLSSNCLAFWRRAVIFLRFVLILEQSSSFNARTNHVSANESCIAVTIYLEFEYTYILMKTWNHFIVWFDSFWLTFIIQLKNIIIIKFFLIAICGVNVIAIFHVTDHNSCLLYICFYLFLQRLNINLLLLALKLASIWFKLVTECTNWVQGAGTVVGTYVLCVTWTYLCQSRMTSITYHYYLLFISGWNYSHLRPSLMKIIVINT